MSQFDPDGKQSGALARIGQNDSLAGLTRLATILFPIVVTAILAWGASDIKAALSDLHENQRAIIALAARTQHIEDSNTNMSGSIHEFREWTVGRVTDLSSLINADGQRINEIDRAQARETSRILCLENHVRCPQ